MLRLRVLEQVEGVGYGRERGVSGLKPKQHLIEHDRLRSSPVGSLDATAMLEKQVSLSSDS